MIAGLSQQNNLLANWYAIVGITVAAIAILTAVWGGLRMFMRMRDVARVLLGVKGGGGVRAEKPLVDLVDEHGDMLAQQGNLLAEMRTQLVGSNGKTIMQTVESVSVEQARVAEELHLHLDSQDKALGQHIEDDAKMQGELTTGLAMLGATVAALKEGEK